MIGQDKQGYIGQIIHQEVQNVRSEVYFSMPCTLRQFLMAVKNIIHHLLIYNFHFTQIQFCFNLADVLDVSLHQLPLTSH
jgi:hypothetical protein